MSFNRGKVKVQSSAKKPKNPYKDDVIWDPDGQWTHPGMVTGIPSGDITMHGVSYPVLGVDNLGNSRVMYPGNEYRFPGSSVIEYPMAYGGSPRIGQIYDRLGRLHPISSYVPFAKKGGQLTPAKAREILHDGTVHGKPITEKQRRYFGYISNLKNGGMKKAANPFNYIQTEEQFFSPVYSNIPSPYRGGSFKMGGFPTFPTFPQQPTKDEIASYGRPNWPYFIAQDGGPADINEGDNYFSNKQKDFTSWLQNTAMAANMQEMVPGFMASGGGLSRQKNYGSKKKPYPSVSSGDFAGPHRSYPIPTKADAVDALRLAGLHGRSDVKAKVYARYPELRPKKDMGGTGYTEIFPYAMPYEYKSGGWIQKAINPAHKGYCTPMTKKTCTPRRKALARRFKSGEFRKQDGGQSQEEKWQAIIALTEQGLTDPADIAREINSEGTYITTPEEVQNYLADYLQGAEEMQMGGGPDMNPGALDTINMYSDAFGSASNDADVNSGLVDFINAGLVGYENMSGVPEAQRGIQYDPSMVPSRMPSYESRYPYYFPDPGYYTNRVGTGSTYDYPMYGRTNLFPANFHPNVRQKLKFQGRKIYMNSPYDPGAPAASSAPGVFYGNPNIEKVKEYNNIFGSGRKVKFRVPYYGELPEEPRKERKSLKDFFKKKKGTPNALPENTPQETPGVMPTSLAPSDKVQWMRENAFPYSSPAPVNPQVQQWLDTQPAWIHQNLAGYNPQFGSSEVNPMTGAYMSQVDFGQTASEPQAPAAQTFPSALPPGRGPLRERLARFLGVNTQSGRYLERHNRKVGGSCMQEGGPYDYLKPDISNMMNPDLDPDMLPGYNPPPTLSDTEMVRAIGDNPEDQVRKPSGYLSGKYKESYGTGMNEEDLANWGIAGLDLLANIASLDEKKDAEKQLKRKFKAENIFASREDRDRGDYTTNQGYFRPDQMVPVQFQGSKAGTYQVGGEYDLTDEEIANLRKGGYVIEFI